MIDKLRDKLLNKTNNGLDIIKAELPDMIDTGGHIKKMFKLRDEKTASAHLYEPSTKLPTYHIMDFGGNSKPMDAISLYAYLHGNLRYVEALFRLCSEYDVNEEISKDKNKPEKEYRKLFKDENIDTKPFKIAAKIPETYLPILGPRVTREVCDELGWKSLDYLGHAFENKETKELTMCIEHSTDDFPILARECHYLKGGRDAVFYKIYEPQNPDKSYRFQYIPKGAKPEKFTNGLAELKKAYEILNIPEEITDEDELEEQSKPQPKKKLRCAVICCGERDALCCKAMGHYPIWFNSETYDPSKEEMDEIRNLVDRIYYIPDLDETGRRRACELAMKFMDIHIVWLPKWLGSFRDHRGRPRKDLRDWSDLRPEPEDFEELLKDRYPAKFWTYENDKNGKSACTISPLRLYNFLELNGYFTIKDEGQDRAQFIKIENNVVSPITARDIKVFVNEWAKERKLPETVRNTIFRSKLFNYDSLENLQARAMDFGTFTYNTQMFFFQKQVILVTPHEIKKMSYGDLGNKFTWGHSVQKYDFKMHEPFFKCRKINGKWEIEVKSTDSYFFKYLINSSRLFWREELEQGFCSDDEKDAYFKNHRFCINGERLDPDMKADQMQTLVAKIFALGYMLHCYKSQARPWAPMCMDNKNGEIEECNGRSGKSFFFKAIRLFRKTVILDGRNETLMLNPHVFDQIDKSTDLVIVDDCSQYFKFDAFYEIISEAMTINPKGLKQFTILFDDSPKFGFTTNYPPKNFTASSEARTLYQVFSDFYHEKSDENDYAESRTIKSDLGLLLFNDTYPQSAWQADYAFLIQCCQFYLSLIEPDERILPPMKNIHLRMMRYSIGSTFEEWAQGFFVRNPENPDFAKNMDMYVKKKDAYDDFNSVAGKNRLTMHSFTKKLKLYCEYSDEIYAYNPDDKCNDKMKHRYIKTENGQSVEYFYVQSIDQSPF